MALISTLCIAAFFVVVCTMLILQFVEFRRKAAILNKLPGAETELLWGNIRQYPGMNDAGLQFLRDDLVLRPRIGRVWLGPVVCAVNALHPETLKPILKSSEPKSRHIYQFLTPWLGEGLLVSNGERWARSRRLLTPAFHFDILKQYITVNNQAADVLIGKLQGYAATNEYFEAFNEVSLYSLDVILQCACSFESECQTKGQNHPYIQAVNELNDLLSKRFLKFYLFSDLVYYLTPDGRRFKKACDYVHKVAEEIIEKRRQDVVHGVTSRRNEQEQDEEGRKKKKHMDFLTILLTARDENGVGLTPLEIRNEVDTFLFEGHDTTTSAISWTLYSLAQNPDIQQKAREEVDGVLAGKESDDIMWEDLPQLTYIEMCIKEGMRLHTPVHFIQRETTTEMTIDGYKIPVGSLINISLYSVLHHHLIWDNPMEYRPERFSSRNTNVRDPYSFVPFSAGPRNCIGQNFAMHEMKTVIARILRRFILETDPNHKVEKKLAAVMKSQNGIRLKAVPRVL